MSRKPVIQAWRMNERITLQQRSTGVDALGQEAVTWGLLRDVWAQVTTRRGREFFAALAVQAEAAVVFRIRYAADLVGASANVRVLWRGVAYDITEPPQDVDGRREAIDLFCVSGATHE